MHPTLAPMMKFESSVISLGNETYAHTVSYEVMFESSVISLGNETLRYLIREAAGLRVVSFR